MEEGSEICVTEKSKEEREVMDTPDRSKSAQIATSIGKFEESPVFNFLNNLSPIKPVKSMHISQTINPLSFASLPSVFTSPHVRSLRESRFLRSHQFSDPSKPEFSSDDGSIIDNSKLSMEGIKALNEKHGNLDRRASDCELAVVPFVEDASQREGFYRNEENTEIVTQIDQNNEASSCDWECLISDASDLLVFESPNNTESYEKSVDPKTNFYRSIENEMQNTLSVGAVAPGEQVGEGSEPENLSTQPGEGIETMEIGETQDIIGGQSVNHPSEKMDFEHLSGFYRGMRRRCLVFEMGGARTRRVDENSGSDSSMLLQSDGNTSFSDQPLVPTKTGNDSSRRVLPGIGLHLNALATTPRDYKIGNCEASAPGRVLVGPISSVNFHPPSTSQELFNNTLALASLEREIDSNDTDVLPVEDACPISELLANEEINQNSPKKKRRRMEQAEETGACKRCNCKKSKCLKLYCECFAAGVYCVEPCACIDCFNKPIHEDTVLATRKQIESRNPLAFAPKVIRSSDSVPEIGDDSSKTPASARHKRGCNCKKSGCLKKYCECYQGGVGCSVNCRCEGCKNAFGRKDGSSVIHTELQLQEDETGGSEKTALQEELDHNMDSVPPATPLLAGRQLVQQPFSSKKKPPKSSFPSIASSSSSFYGNQSFAKPSFFQPPPKFDKRFETVAEDEIPDFLQESSPISGIKSSSPNGKRVSSPHGVRLSPGLKSNRKLILQSIPSFPSLTSNQ